MSPLLLKALDALFRGKVYRHRASNQGDLLARYFYEDLYALRRSPLFDSRIERQDCVVNTMNVVPGKRGRRGDGTFGGSGSSPSSPCSTPASTSPPASRRTSRSASR
jgi:hypothetical protein